MHAVCVAGSWEMELGESHVGHTFSQRLLLPVSEGYDISVNLFMIFVYCCIPKQDW